VVFREIKEFFNVFDYAGRIEFIGGEALMYPHLLDVVRYAVTFKERFGFLRITTNSTLVPRDDFLEYIRGCGVRFDFILDDYGAPSKAHAEIIEKMERFGVPYRVDCYHGDAVHFNGWIDFGDHSDKNYSDAELENVFSHCTAAQKNPFYAVFNGQVHPCVYSLAGQNTGRLKPKPGEWIDLFDESMTLRRKKEIAAGFLKTPFSACRHCNGFLTETAPRVPAGKQLNLS
jgi:hypothetical protein